jgi:hypothetical protein
LGGRWENGAAKETLWGRWKNKGAKKILHNQKTGRQKKSLADFDG